MQAMPIDRRPRIGITANTLPISDGPFLGEERVYVNRGYTDCIAQAGGLPLLIPITADIEAIRWQLELVDGIIFSGGQDVHPSFYSEAPHALLGSTSIERDQFEMAALRIAYERRLPTLGICRGLQLMNVFFGGTLYQDISLKEPTLSVASHQQETDDACHPIDLRMPSLIHDIFGENRLLVNSVHHQAICTLAQDLVVEAVAIDGTIEAISHAHAPWMLGVQWHPEVMREAMSPLFTAFVTAARCFRGQP